MLAGTADPERLAGGAARMQGFDAGPVELRGATVFQGLFEMRATAREPLLPPGLHPTNPATLVVLGWQCPESPWGPFSLCQLRVGCRSGVRTRGLVLACAGDAPEASRALGSGWGFGVRPGRIRLSHRYDGATLQVTLEGREALRVEALRPEPLAPGDVQYTGTLTLAHTPRGLRLVQVEPRYAVARAERVRPRLAHFDAQVWGRPALSPYHPVSASIARADVTLPPIRFVCRPDVSAFAGTEPVQLQPARSG